MNLYKTDSLQLLIFETSHEYDGNFFVHFREKLFLDIFKIVIIDYIEEHAIEITKLCYRNMLLAPPSLIDSRHSGLQESDIL
jgi:hypothetical protein